MIDSFAGLFRSCPAVVACMMLLSNGCSGDRSSIPSQPAMLLLSGRGPAVALPPRPNWARNNFLPVIRAIEAYDDRDFTVIAGDNTGILFEYEKGNFPASDQYAVGSASKWFTSAAIMRLVDQGVMRLSDKPQDYLPYWTTDPWDARSRITMAQLLSFTSGFNANPLSGGCTADGKTTLQACAREIYQGGIATDPGTAFSYGPDHMHVAAAMAERATGHSFNAIFRENVAIPLGMTEASQYIIPSASNPLVSGGAASTGRDYAIFLQALLDGSLIADRRAWLRDRTAGIPFLFRPRGAEESGDWHYALGAWLECDEPRFSPACAHVRIYSSPGSFGWTPWIDFRNGYFALIARRGKRFSTPVAVQLEQLLQPLIEEALAH